MQLALQGIHLRLRRHELLLHLPVLPTPLALPLSQPLSCCLLEAPNLSLQQVDPHLTIYCSFNPPSIFLPYIQLLHLPLQLFDLVHPLADDLLFPLDLLLQPRDPVYPQVKDLAMQLLAFPLLLF